MKFSISCFLLILSSILLMSQNSYARKDSGDYWKSVMNDQPMPEAIKDLFVHQDHEHQVPSKEKSHFVGDFDMRPNAIIYHGAHHHQDQPAENKPFFKKASYIQTVNHG
ncbi:hypothetical protein ACFX12_003117 [Malus domestica]